MIEDISVDKPFLMLGDCAERMKEIPDGSIDLTVTSPPYDDMRKYNGYSFEFESVARELYRATKPGGVVVWIVGDATVKGSETGSSFRQALYFKDVCGFNLHDTMIWNKEQSGFSAVGALSVRYAPVFEYMFILSKGRPKTFNPLKDRKNKSHGRIIVGTGRNADGTIKPMSNPGKLVPKFGQRFNVWNMSAEMRRGIHDHPAPFPEPLARDHILSWSNSGDVVLDPFLGSGTTGRMAVILGRKFIGIEISDKYMESARRRMCLGDLSMNTCDEYQLELDMK